MLRALFSSKREYYASASSPVIPGTTRHRVWQDQKGRWVYQTYWRGQKAGPLRALLLYDEYHEAIRTQGSIVSRWTTPQS